jgi:proteasome alpha subunit
MAVDALGRDADPGREIPANRLEVAVLDRSRAQRRKFRRINGSALESMLGDTASSA